MQQELADTNEWLQLSNHLSHVDIIPIRTAPIEIEMKFEETSLSKGNFYTDVQRQFQQTVAAPGIHCRRLTSIAIFAKSKPRKPVRLPTSRETMDEPPLEIGKPIVIIFQRGHHQLRDLFPCQLHEKCLLRGSTLVLSLFVTLTE